MSQPEDSDGAAAASGPERIAAGLRHVRNRTLELVQPLSDDALQRQHSPLMSPIIWDMGHIAEFEDLWLVRSVGQAASETQLPETYDAMRTPRSRRSELELPGRGAMLERLADVRAAADLVLTAADMADPSDRLLSGGYVYELVLEHEAQHQETILQTIHLMDSEPYTPVRRRPAPEAEPATAGEMIRVPAGIFRMGSDGAAFAYDNEVPEHPVTTGAFEIGRYPVTNGEYLEFIAAGGYEERALWSPAGWAWKEEAGAVAPLFWRPADEAGTPSVGAAAWCRSTALGVQVLDPQAPVVNVCLHEAEAFARFAAARLPTEAEWEKAAAWDPDSGASFRHPWGDAAPEPNRANLDQLLFGVAPIGSFPAGRSPVGCEQMLGDVWEWTSSRFAAYPGFVAFPYEEYSAVFFGDDYTVLRGASWATGSSVARNTFRNWDCPIRRQIFAGLRIARDV